MIPRETGTLGTGRKSVSIGLFEPSVREEGTNVDVGATLYQFYCWVWRVRSLQEIVYNSNLVDNLYNQVDTDPR